MDAPIYQDAFSVEDFAKRHGISRSTAYEEIKDGHLIARKLGKRTLIVAEDARAWRESLPKSHDVSKRPTIEQ